MQKNTVVAAVVSVVIGVVGTNPASAQFLIGPPPIPVIDVGMNAQTKSVLATLAGILGQSVAIYNVAKTQATPKGSKNWVSIFKTLANSSIISRCGETLNMAGAINSGLNIASVWKRATVALPIVCKLTRETLGSSANIAHLATLEMQDSASMTAMTSLGEYRTMQVQNQTDYDNLESLVLSTNPADNTEDAQLNIANGVALQQLKAIRTQTGINASLLEQQLAANKYSRDSMASHLNLFSDIDQQRSGSQTWMIDPDQSGRQFLVP